MIAQPIGVSAMSEKAFSKLKGDEKRWRVEDGAGILRRHMELLKDPEWLKASQAELKKQNEDGEDALKSSLAYKEMGKKKNDR